MKNIKIDNKIFLSQKMMDIDKYLDFKKLRLKPVNRYIKNKNYSLMNLFKKAGKNLIKEFKLQRGNKNYNVQDILKEVSTAELLIDSEEVYDVDFLDENIIIASLFGESGYSKVYNFLNFTIRDRSNNYIDIIGLLDREIPVSKKFNGRKLDGASEFSYHNDIYSILGFVYLTNKINQAIYIEDSDVSNIVKEAYELKNVQKHFTRDYKTYLSSKEKGYYSIRLSEIFKINTDNDDEKSFIPFAFHSYNVFSFYLKMLNKTISYFGNLNYKEEVLAKSNNKANIFVTKKNIPKKIKEVMKNNEFLKEFKFVEIDEDIDLNSFYEHEKEWVKLRETGLLKNIDLSETNLRFRKIAYRNYSGIFSERYNTIVLDIKSGYGSLTHELFHLLDFLNFKKNNEYLHETKEFEKIYSLYIEELKRELENKSVAKKDINYVFSKQEIFARCGEIYLVKILNLNNKLSKKEFGTKIEIYPTNNSKLLEEIKKYYSLII